MRRANTYPQRGLTLIEMIITILVLGIFISIAVPSYKGFIAGQRVKTVAFNLGAAMRYARSEAIKRGANVTLSATSGAWANGWTVQSGTIILNTQEALSSSVTVTGVGGITSLTYQRSGRVSVAPKIQIDATDSSLGIPSRCISIELSGLPKSVHEACS